MRAISLAIVGAGGSYTPEIVEGILQRDAEELPVEALNFIDPDQGRLNVMAGLARRMIAAANRSIEVVATSDLETGLRGVSFVISQIRVGGMAARLLDETIPIKFGIIGQETTGPGGMFKALRTIPPMLEIARAVAKVAPEAVILNYTNPSGVVTEAVLNHSDARIFGLCSSIPLLSQWLKRRLADQFGPVEIYSAGLNHLGFVYRIVDADGREVLDEALSHLRKVGTNEKLMTSSLEASRALGVLPVPKYGDLYLHRRREVADQAAATLQRAERVREIEARVLAEAADLDLAAKPPSLAARGGEGYSGVTFDTLAAVLHDRPTTLVMSARNGGAIAGIPQDASVELNCRVDASGAHPLSVGELPASVRGLVQAVKSHESLTVLAAVHRDRDVALQALLAHPLVGDLDVAEPLLDEMLRAHELDYR